MLVGGFERMICLCCIFHNILQMDQCFDKRHVSGHRSRRYCSKCNITELPRSAAAHPSRRAATPATTAATVARLAAPAPPAAASSKL